MSRRHSLLTRHSSMSQRGFTLLELLISMTLLVIIVVIISGSMRLASRSVAAGEKKVEALERLTTSLFIINAQIQSAAPLTYNDQGTLLGQGMQPGQSSQAMQPGQSSQAMQATQPTQASQSTQAKQNTQSGQTVQANQNVQAGAKFYFRGDRRFFQFSSNYSVWGGQKGYVIVTYRIETDQYGKLSLYASEHLVGVEATRETKLLDGFDDIAFEYFQNGLATGESGMWIQDWTSETAVPSKIRLYLLSGTKERMMIIPIRAKPLIGSA